MGCTLLVRKRRVGGRTGGDLAESMRHCNQSSCVCWGASQYLLHSQLQLINATREASAIGSVIFLNVEPVPLSPFLKVRPATRILPRDDKAADNDCLLSAKPTTAATCARYAQCVCATVAGASALGQLVSRTRCKAGKRLTWRPWDPLLRLISAMQ